MKPIVGEYSHDVKTSKQATEFKFETPKPETEFEKKNDPRGKSVVGTSLKIRYEIPALAGGVFKIENLGVWYLSNMYNLWFQ